MIHLVQLIHVYIVIRNAGNPSLNNIKLRLEMIQCVVIFCSRIIPESFRWYLSHGRLEEAEKVLEKVAKFNKKPCISLKQLEELDLTDGEDNGQGDRKYTLLDIFKSRYLIKLSLLLSTVWYVQNNLTESFI